MTYKYLNWFGLSVFLMVGIVACGSGSGSGGGNGIAVTPNNGCPAGYTITYQYGYASCLGPNGQIVPITQSNLGGTLYSGDNYCLKTLNVTNTNIFSQFIAETMGTYAMNVASKVEISTNGSSQMGFRFTPYGSYMPMTVTMTVYPINNSKGFEGRAYGPVGTVGHRGLIQFQVAEGKHGDPYYTFALSYAPTTTGIGTTFITGTLVNNNVYSPSYYGCY